MKFFSFFAIWPLHLQIPSFWMVGRTRATHIAFKHQIVPHTWPLSTKFAQTTPMIFKITQNVPMPFFQFFLIKDKKKKKKKKKKKTKLTMSARQPPHAH
jgi:hypothetical protein